MTLTPEQLDDVYTELCYSMTDRKYEEVHDMLARVALALIYEVGDVERVRGAIRAALAAGPEAPAGDRP